LSLGKGNSTSSTTSVCGRSHSTPTIRRHLEKFPINHSMEEKDDIGAENRVKKSEPGTHIWDLRNMKVPPLESPKRKKMEPR